MVVINGPVVDIMGSPEEISLDLLVLIDSLNKFKEDRPETWNILAKVCKETLTNMGRDVVKDFLDNLKDLV